MNVAAFLEPADWFRSKGGPRYIQLRQRLSDGVTTGQLATGSPLPPEREIAAITGFSRVTVRKAIRSLAEDGVILQKQGSGSFIASRPKQMEQNLSRLTSFSEEMARRGKDATSRWLERGLFMPSADEITCLCLTNEDQVARITRLRLADGDPIAIERASLPTDILPNPLAVETSLYETLEGHGHRPVKALQKISAINLTDQDADLLATSPKDAGLQIERTSYLSCGRVAEFTQSTYRKDAYTFIAELRLAKEPA
ncbi:GntR family transcriptional regulator [Roseobacter denitrificans]|uniref:Transcriptional regulator, GntR family, putative n=1 Tax=Roseobacter denitrificans (strain ATCC 33942 / OCh 114) TaxID=375451 RepID=Q169J4_ROSDO|nr:GntR family transcriptional regulator [Roseobacter denitrificans]ABG31349.1 transcriptional regulator, GntR family, putative [Roseobacter denitrificans OCh 114]AVL54373.1 GntR family transcriptional regulator [Roseobacter denitrificans]SFF99860.1 transcriptional regulator, GntR family [Roseobacter denitrificans OCh 114]